VGQLELEGDATRSFPEIDSEDCERGAGKLIPREGPITKDNLPTTGNFLGENRDFLAWKDISPG
jgi:hypothetical protein